MLGQYDNFLHSFSLYAILCLPFCYAALKINYVYLLLTFVC